MAKKIGKSKSSSRKIKKHVATKKTAEIQKPVKSALHEFEILSEEKKVENKISGMESMEEDIKKEEAKIISEEKNIEKEEEKVENIEESIKKETAENPLTKLTMHDINKGIIGAFIGVVAHFAFIYGRQIAKDITTARATVLIIFSYALIVMLMYETGYRDIKEKRILGILPKRATVIYLTSIIVIPLIFFLFNQLNLSDPVDLFKQIAVSSVFASIGAGTADIIGKS